MSLDVSNDPGAINPFEMLCNDTILHIFSFLPGADLLELATVDKNFNRIITKTGETMRKIPLVLGSNNRNLDLDFAIKFAQTRRFTAFRLNLFKFADVANVKFLTLLELLSGSVDDLTVEGYTSRELLSTIIATFLPKLKKCKLDSVRFQPEASPFLQEINPRSNVNHSLQSLKLINHLDLEVLRFFTGSGCNQLKEFRCDWVPDTAAEDIDQVNNFLATQDRLEKLTFGNEEIAWNRLICFKLRELTAECLPGTDDELAAVKFLKKLPNLAKLDITFYGHPSRPIMSEICRAPKLEKLSIRCWNDEDKHEDSLDMLVNHTVKELQIEDCTGITNTTRLLKIFLGVDTVYFRMSTNSFEELDLSDVPYETIEKIKLNENSYEGFHVKFSPSNIPTNVEQFESAVMKFADEFSTLIVGIKIGHVSWLNSEAFRLSNSFFENLVNHLPELVDLEVFNIADRGKFISFLDENKARLNLEDVELHEPNGAGEPQPKKMRIQVD